MCVFSVWCSVFVTATFCVVFFLFKQKTAYEVRISDWSSDVCSSDLGRRGAARRRPERRGQTRRLGRVARSWSIELWQRAHGVRTEPVVRLWPARERTSVV